MHSILCCSDLTKVIIGLNCDLLLPDTPVIRVVQLLAQENLHFHSCYSTRWSTLRPHNAGKSDDGTFGAAQLQNPSAVV